MFRSTGRGIRFVTDHSNNLRRWEKRRPYPAKGGIYELSGFMLKTLRKYLPKKFDEQKIWNELFKKKSSSLFLPIQITNPQVTSLSVWYRVVSAKWLYQSDLVVLERC